MFGIWTAFISLDFCTTQYFKIGIYYCTLYIIFSIQLTIEYY